MILWPVFVLVLTVFVVRKMLHLYSMDRMVANLPSPKSLPLIGHYHLLFGSSAREFYDNAIRLSFDFDRTFKCWLGPVLTVIVQDKEHIRAVLQCYEKSFIYQFFPKFVHASLVMSKGMHCAQWKRLLFSNALFSLQVPYGKPDETP